MEINVKKMKSIRKRKLIPLSALSRLCRRPISYFAKIEAGDRSLSYGELTSIALALEIKASELIENN